MSQASRAVAPRGPKTFDLEGGGEIGDKDSFLDAASRAMVFPDYFGHNWDAFEECIRDLGWAPASEYVALYDHVDRFACADPSASAIALDIFCSAVQHWSNRGTTFFDLLKGNPTPTQNGPTLHWPELADPASPSAVRRLDLQSSHRPLLVPASPASPA